MSEQDSDTGPPRLDVEPQSLTDWLFDRRTSFIDRWHHRPTTHSESLIEHQGYVARHVSVIVDILQWRGIDVDKVRAIDIALFHDEPEIITGDFAGSWKAQHEGAKKIMVEWEVAALEESCFLGLPRWTQLYYRELIHAYVDPQDVERSIEGQIVYYVDKVSALAFILEEQAHGNTRIEVIANQLRATVTNMRWPWLELLRHKYGAP